jgi:hypothetical protein
MILNVSRFLAVLTLLVGVSVHPLPPYSVRGTLGVFIPSAEGLVVAADSRSLLLGKACDEVFKIIEGRRSAALSEVSTPSASHLARPAAILARKIGGLGRS